MVFKFKKKIYGFECDVYGHLNNANYLQIYESARAEALEEAGMPIRKLKETGYLIFLIKVEIEYKKGIQLEDIITVHSSVIENNRLGSLWVQKIYNSAGELCNIVYVRGVYVKDNKPSRISQELKVFFDKFLETE